MKSRHGTHEDTSLWYLMDVFDNQVLDSASNLIAVGSAETNPLVRSSPARGRSPTTSCWRRSAAHTRTRAGA